MIRLSRLAASLARKHGISQRAAERFLATMAEVMNDGLHYDKTLKVKGLGSFKVTSVNARESVNVNTGERILIDGREKITFTPEQSMRDFVNKPFAQFETVVVNDGVDFDAIDKKYALTEEIANEEEDSTETAGESIIELVENEDVVTPEGKFEEETAEEPIVEETAEPATEQETEVSEPAIVALADMGNEVQSEETSAAEEAIVILEPEEEEIAEPEVEVESEPEVEVESEPEVEVETEPEEVVESEPESESEPEVEETEPAEELAETTEEPLVAETTADEVAEEESEPQVEEPFNTTSDDMNINNEDQETKLDEYGYPIENDLKIKELSTRLDKTDKWMKGLLATVLCMLVLAVCGAYFLSKQLKDRDRRIESLVAQIQEDQLNANVHKTGVTPAPGRPQKEDPSVEKRKEMDQQMKEHERRVNELREQQKLADEERAEAVRKAEQARKVEEARQEQIRQKEILAAKKAEQARQDEIKKKAEEARKAQAAKAAAAKQAAPAAAQSKYDQDPRVRLGAYVITGVSETVTVRQGQTLASISKAYLGPGMECYVEAVNGGIKEVKAGQKLKIPALKLKKAARKK